MTTELEEEFFKVFGVEPKWQYKVQQFCHFYLCDQKTILENAYLFKERKTCKVKEVKKTYPEITDRKLLELICIQGNTDYFMIDNSGNPISVNGLKESVLHTLTLFSKHHKELKQQIQQLFKEGE